MPYRIKVAKEFCHQCTAELVSGIHIKPVIKTIGVITLINFIDGMPVKKKSIGTHIYFGREMKISKKIGTHIFFQTNILTCSYRNISVSSISHFKRRIINNKRLYVVVIFPVE